MELNHLRSRYQRDILTVELQLDCLYILSASAIVVHPTLLPFTRIIILSLLYILLAELITIGCFITI